MGKRECGCEAYVTKRGLLSKEYGDSARISQCPLHRHAPEMLVVLKDVRAFLKRSGYDTSLVNSVVTKAEGTVC